MTCVYDKRGHELQIVSHIQTRLPGLERVVRWCCKCGGVVIDTDNDGRTIPGDILPMTFPNISLDAAKVVK